MLFAPRSSRRKVPIANPRRKGSARQIYRPRTGQDVHSRSGTMNSHYLNIMTAWVIATVPILVLAIVFLVVVEYSRPRAPPGSYYSDERQASLPLGSAIYSRIPSTQLTFIASFSSTLATAVLPATMALFSYVVALVITRDSDLDHGQRLPSPYQLELLISILDGSLLALWSFAKYTLSWKSHRITMVPILKGAACIMGITVVLAYESPEPIASDVANLHRLLVALTDAWLNFVMSPYHL